MSARDDAVPLPPLEHATAGGSCALCGDLVNWGSHVVSALLRLHLPGPSGLACNEPRLDWSSRSALRQIAPEGQQGSYFALGNAPLFLPKLLAGVFSGYLLEEYCAAEPCQGGPLLWRAIFLSGLPFPLAIFVLRRWLRGSSS